MPVEPPQVTTSSPVDHVAPSTALPSPLVEALTRHVGPADPVRLDAVLQLAAAALRRVPAATLGVADIEALAERLADAFDFADQRDRAVAIRVFAPDVGLDGTAAGGTVIEVNNTDAPFLVSTITEELRIRGLGIVRSLHPILGIERDADGRILRIGPARQAANRESLIHIQLDTQLTETERDDLARSLRALLHDAHRAAADYTAMKAAIQHERDSVLVTAGSVYAEDEVQEAADLLTWLLDGNFVLLGARTYEVLEPGGDEHVRVVPGSGLGILRTDTASRYAEPQPIAALELELRERFLSGPLVQVSRTRRLSTVHRRARMEYVGLKRLDADGRVIGEFRLLGLFTKKAYAEPSSSTPVLRRKLLEVLALEDIVEGSHDEISLVALYQALPKDELFQADVAQLRRTLIDLLRAEEQADTRVLVRVDGFTHTVSVLISVPWERYSAALRESIQRLLIEAYDGDRVDVDLSIGDRQEAICRFAVHTRTSDIPHVDEAQLEATIRRMARSWLDDVTAELTLRHGEADGTLLSRTLASRLPDSYRARTSAAAAATDIAMLRDLAASDEPLRVALRPTDGAADTAASSNARVLVHLCGGELELSAFLPVLESLGLTVIDERPHLLSGDGPALAIHDFGVRRGDGDVIDVAQDGDRVAAAVLAAWSGQLEIDSLNRLVVGARLDWRDVGVLRAYRRYQRQAGTPYTPEYVNDALALNPDAAAALVAVFHARFDPSLVSNEAADDARESAARERVGAACDAVARLDHDRILRGVLAVIDATLRTNFYRDDAEVLAFKLDPSAVPGLPQPIPYREIFIYSPLVEGIHLRGGPVARGGLRWSDRHDDYRTEVLGLMKAQVLKNAVIVPTGAKGGFTVKKAPSDPAELRAAVEDRYRAFIGGLLDVTDNLHDGAIVPPPSVRRRDGDDPYLVVAADKGTATFSDTANAIAIARGFWLGDAFASGGSQGYDHKALGITARGAWVSVQRHFRELGVDVQTEPVTVAGVGDMSGDVFGNGMLLSPQIRLIGAFDHRDIFLDPEPDPAVSFAERERLFGVVRSSWQDYDRALISAGGGVFPRSSKRIELTPEIRERLRIEDASLTPDELIRAILRAPVDLLWAGGIGTYIKASDETHEAVGDRNNDEVRVDATDLRARVVAEGGNLFATQRARVQYARRGGRINTDAIDNSAGVGTSDDEVNVKILLGDALAAGEIDRAERDRLLVEVTDDVVRHVLRANHLQNLRLLEEAGTSAGNLDTYEELMVTLEEHGLDRGVEHLPSTLEMHDRAERGGGLTRPELAVVLGHTKRVLKDDLLASELPDDPATEDALFAYFPAPLVARFAPHVRAHRLRRELIATVVANEAVNRLGIPTVFRIADETGASRVAVVAAFWAARTVSEAERSWDDIDDLAAIADPQRQLELKATIDVMVDGLTRRYLRELADLGAGGITALTTRDRPVFVALSDGLGDIGTASQRRARRDATSRLIDDLLEPELAARLTAASDLAVVPEVAATIQLTGGTRAPMVVADAFLVADEALGLDRLRRLTNRAAAEDRWSRLQRVGLLTDLDDVRRTVVRAALTSGTPGAEAADVASYVSARGTAIGHTADLLREVEHTDEVRLDALAVVVRALTDATRPRD